ncbi:MAG TPA: hypothetical protein VN608_04505 [Clostridia bacterium]|nr:hypothetical protein [Clostridia bacterium]
MGVGFGVGLAVGLGVGLGVGFDADADCVSGFGVAVSSDICAFACAGIIGVAISDDGGVTKASDTFEGAGVIKTSDAGVTAASIYTTVGSGIFVARK